MDLSCFIPDRYKKRMEINIPLDAVMLISVGELNENKNNQVIIKALGKLKNRNIHYVLCGVGNRELELKALARKMDVVNNVHFLGYRTDVKELMNAGDVFVMPSLREGLSRSIMEAMASGLPCVVSRVRGNVDLVKNGENGFLVDPNSTEEMAAAISEIIQNRKARLFMERNSLIGVKKFSSENARNKLSEIYNKEFLR